MECRICGGKLDPRYPNCPCCGTVLSPEECLELTGSETIIAEEYDQKRSKARVLLSVVAIILVIAILSLGGYYALSKHLNPEKPQLSFESGYGVINGDEPVIYVEIGKNAQLEYIHGVKLYAYDKSDSSAIGDSISTDYEYTKSDDGTFRTIFFDASKFDLAPDEEYTYTFEMSFSFVDSTKIFVYQQAVTFPGEISGDASDVVFDHSMDTTSDVTQEATQEELTTEATTQATTKPEQTTSLDVSFIYSSFWFMTPYNDADNYSISSVKFEKNGTCSFTNFFKAGSANWTQTNTKGTYEISGTTLMVTDSEGMTESYVIDSSTKTLAGLEARRYNSTKNAEDFFGI